MMSSYLLYRLFQRSINEKYEESSEEEVSENIKGICRVCLKDGTIPIYEDTDDLSNEIRTFGEIELSEHDGFPQHICRSCYDMLQTAKKFRKAAKQSSDILSNQSIASQWNTSLEITKFSEVTVKEENSVPVIIKSEPGVTKLVNFVRRRTKAPKIKCQICYRYITKTNLQTHMLIHNDANLHKFICEVCGKQFKQKCTYDIHRTVHRSEFPFKCDSCPYRGKTLGLLKTHMLTHGAHKFMCSECPAQFHTKSNLNKHFWKHKKPEFKCDLCKRAFHAKRLLEKHFKALHLGLKDHICETCGKGFGYRGALRKHELDVHKREKTKIYGRKPGYLEAELNSQEGSAVA